MLPLLHRPSCHPAHGGTCARCARVVLKHSRIPATAAGSNAPSASDKPTSTQRRRTSDAGANRRPSTRPKTDEPTQSRRRSNDNASTSASSSPSTTIAARLKAVGQLLLIEEEGAYADVIGPLPRAAEAAAPAAITPYLEDADELSDLVAEDHLPAATVARHRRQKEQQQKRGQQQRGQQQGQRQPRALTSREQRLLTQLVAGVTRWRKRLDFTISALTRKNASDIDPPLRQVLRMGLYELQYRDLPHHALSEHVQVAKVLRGTGGASLANGVLRTAARHMDAGTLPVPEEAAEGASGRVAVRALALAHSHPTWMVTRWLARFGLPATRALLEANNRYPVYGVRINDPDATAPAELLADLLDAGVDVEASALLPGEFLRVSAGLQEVLQGGWLARGEVAVQDESAGLVVALLDPRPGERVIDCCAAPGGKALFAAGRMKGQGSITAMDINAARLRALSQAASLMGPPGAIVTVLAADLREFAAEAAAGARATVHGADGMSTSGLSGGAAGGDAEGAVGEGGDASSSSSAAADAAKVGSPEGGSSSSSSGGGSGADVAPISVGSRGEGGEQLYDKVLLDVPCSGTGVMVKRADLRWRRDMVQLNQLMELQDELLDSAATLVRPGGVLVYSTCSIEEEEGRLRVAAFLSRNGGFEVERPAAGQLPAAVVTEEGFLTTLPHVHGTDGAFAARMRRMG